jgi:2-methylcitrate dehydratase PrpD
VRSWVADSDHIEKAFDFGGMPARNGVIAATLVQTGFTGMVDVFEGEKNFLSAYSPSPEPGRLVQDLGSSYEIMTTSIKLFPVGAPIQAAAEALLLIKERHELRPESIERVVVRLPVDGAETVNDRHMPDINLQYIISVILLDGNLSFKAAHDYRRMKEKRLVKMKARVQLLPDESLSHAQIPRQGIVEVTTQSGENFREHVVSARGTPDNPMSTEEVEKKALHLMAPVLGEGQAQELIDKISKLESLATARELGSLLKK